MFEGVFNIYAKELMRKAELIQGFRLGNPFTYKIDWDIAQEAKDNRRRIRSDHLEQMYVHKNEAALYYFTVNSCDITTVFNRFTSAKDFSAKLRREMGVKADGFLNISHVPGECKDTECLYVGSVKKNLATRFSNHLGLIKSGRTGALYLLQVFKDLNIRPSITFNYHVLDSKYTRVTEHLEACLQDQLKPMIGRRAFNAND